jgi:uncharacterized membrane protein YGL010W
MRTAAQWLDDYGDSHRNPTNKKLHWICVPVIAWCVLGLLWSLPFPGGIRASYPAANWAGVAVLAALLYYAVLSPRLALGALPLLLLGLWSLDRVDRWHGLPLWGTCLLLFVIAWIGQFIGHAVEGKRPSFFKDVQFLMIGPLWLLADVYRRVGLRF